jgi:protein gp37
MRTFVSPLRWKEPKLTFVCSLSDFFIKEADEWRDEAWTIMQEAPQHVYLLLTKRPHRIAECLPREWPMSNVWFGVTVENNHKRHRLITLQKLGWPNIFVSAEPLLGQLDLRGYLSPRPWEYWVDDIPYRMVLPPLAMTIVGGESGAGFRTLNMEWVRKIRDDCIAADVPFHFKQKSAFRPGFDPTVDGVEWRQLPDAWKVGDND